METEWTTLKDASKKTGYSVRELMDHIKNGRIKEWKKFRTLFGEELRISEIALKNLVGPSEEKKIQGNPREKVRECEKDQITQGSDERVIPYGTILDRYEQAISRCGWLEGELESYKRLLAESQENRDRLEEELRKERERITVREREVEERLAQAHIIEGKYREEKREWERRLANQAAQIREKERECNIERERIRQKEDGLNAMKAQVDTLMQYRDNLLKEREKLMLERDELIKKLEKARRWWKF